MTSETPRLYQSAHPGSMSRHADGGYVDKTDNESLAEALLQNLYKTQEYMEDWKQDALRLERELAAKDAEVRDAKGHIEHIDRLHEQSRAQVARLAGKMTSIRDDVVLDCQDTEYYKRLIGVYRAGLHETLASLPDQAKRDVATELKRRLTEPSEREKVLVTVARFIRDDCSHHSNDTDTSYAAMLTEALTAYEKEEVK